MKQWWDNLCDKAFDLLPYPIYSFYNNWLKLSTWKTRIKFLYQRLRYGFDESETWNLDHSFFKWIYPRLKMFQKLNIGYPTNYESFELWDIEIQSRIMQVESIIKYANNDYSFPFRQYLTEEDLKSLSEVYDEEIINSISYEKCQEDFLNWFGKNCQHLWW